MVRRLIDSECSWGLCVVLCSSCWGCTLLNDTDYLGKDYGQPTAVDGGSCSGVPGTLFCEDFEGANAPDPQRWTTQATLAGASLGIDRSVHHSGTQSLHAQLAIDSAGATDPVAMLNHPQPLPAHFFARFFLYVNSADVQTPEAIVNFQMHDGSAGVQVALQRNWQANLPPAVAFEFWGSTSGGFQVANPITYGRWECIQWEVNEATGQAFVSLDGGQALSVQVTSIAAYDVLAVGIAFAGAMAAGTYEVWIDDVAVGTSPIGCDG